MPSCDACISEARPPKQNPIDTTCVAPEARSISDVGSDLLVARRRPMRGVVEVVVAMLRTRGASVRVDRDPVDPGIREVLGQSLVVPMEASDVGDDHDARGSGLAGVRDRCREAVPVVGD